MRARFCKELTQSAIMLRGLKSADPERIGYVERRARCSAAQAAIEQIAGCLSPEPSVCAVQWSCRR